MQLPHMQVDEIDALLNEVEVEAWKLATAKYMALRDGKTRSAIQTDGTTTQIEGKTGGAIQFWPLCLQLHEENYTGRWNQ